MDSRCKAEIRETLVRSKVDASEVEEALTDIEAAVSRYRIRRLQYTIRRREIEAEIRAEEAAKLPFDPGI